MISFRVNEIFQYLSTDRKKDPLRTSPQPSDGAGLKQLSIVPSSSATSLPSSSPSVQASSSQPHVSGPKSLNSLMSSVLSDGVRNGDDLLPCAHVQNTQADSVDIMHDIGVFDKLMSKSYSELLAQKLCPEIKKSRNERRKQSNSVDRTKSTATELSESEKSQESQTRQQTDCCQSCVNCNDTAEKGTVLSIQQAHGLLSPSHAAKVARCLNLPSSSPRASGTLIVPAALSQMPFGSSSCSAAVINNLKIDESTVPSATRVTSKKTTKSAKGAGLLLTDDAKVDKSVVTSSSNKTCGGLVSLKDAGKNFVTAPSAGSLVAVERKDCCKNDLVMAAMKMTNFSDTKFNDAIKTATAHGRSGGGISLRTAANYNGLVNTNIIANAIRQTVPARNKISTTMKSEKASEAETTVCTLNASKQKETNLAELDSFTELSVNVSNDSRLSSPKIEHNTDAGTLVANRVTDVACDEKKSTNSGRSKKKKASALRKAAARKAAKESDNRSDITADASMIKPSGNESGSAPLSTSDSNISAMVIDNTWVAKAGNIQVGHEQLNQDEPLTVSQEHPDSSQEHPDSCPENWEHRVVETPPSSSPEGGKHCNDPQQTDSCRRRENASKKSGRAARVSDIRRCSESSADSEISQGPADLTKSSIRKRGSVGSVESGCSSESRGVDSACSLVSEISGELLGNFGSDFSQAYECYFQELDCIGGIDAERQHAMEIFAETSRNGYGSIADLDTFDTGTLVSSARKSTKTTSHNVCMCDGASPKTVADLDTFDDIPDCLHIGPACEHRDGFFIAHRSNVTTNPSNNAVNSIDFTTDDQWTKVNRKAKKLVVSLEATNRILGADGAKLSAISRVTGANIELEKTPTGSNIPDRTFLINGNTEQINSAYNLLTTLANTTMAIDHRIKKDRRKASAVKTATSCVDVDPVGDAGGQVRGSGGGDKPSLPKMENGSNIWYNRLGQCIILPGSAIRRPVTDAAMAPRNDVSQQRVLASDFSPTDSVVQNSLRPSSGHPHKADPAQRSPELSCEFFKSCSGDDRQSDNIDRRSSSVSRLPTKSGTVMPTATCSSIKTNVVVRPDADILSSLTFANGPSTGPTGEYSLFSSSPSFVKSPIGVIGSELGEQKNRGHVVEMKRCQQPSMLVTTVTEKPSLAVQRPDSRISPPSKKSDSHQFVDRELLIKAPGYRVISSPGNTLLSSMNPSPTAVPLGSPNNTRLVDKNNYIGQFSEGNWQQSHIYDSDDLVEPPDVLRDMLPYSAEKLVESLTNCRSSSPPQRPLSVSSIPQNVAVQSEGAFASELPTSCNLQLHSAISDGTSSFQNTAVTATSTCQQPAISAEASVPVPTSKGLVKQPSPYDMVLPQIQTQLNPFADDFVFDITKKTIVENRREINSAFDVEGGTDFNGIAGYGHITRMPHGMTSSSQAMHLEYSPKDLLMSGASHLFPTILLEDSEEMQNRKSQQFHLMRLHHHHPLGLGMAVGKLPSNFNSASHPPLVAQAKSNRSQIPESLVTAGNWHDSKGIGGRFTSYNGVVAAASPETFSKTTRTSAIGGGNDSVSFASSLHSLEPRMSMVLSTEAVSENPTVIAVSSFDHSQPLLESSDRHHISPANNHISFQNCACQSTDAANCLPVSRTNHFNSSTNQFLASHSSSSSSSPPQGFRSNDTSLPSDPTYCDQIRSSAAISIDDRPPSQHNCYNHLQEFSADPNGSPFSSSRYITNGVPVFPMAQATVVPPVVYAEFPVPSVNELWSYGSSTSHGAFHENSPSLWAGYAQPLSR